MVMLGVVEDPEEDSAEPAETVLIETVCADVYVPAARLKVGAGADGVMV